MMRLGLTAAALVAFVFSAPAVAQNYDTRHPVCLKLYFPVTNTDCRYTSIAQCKESASGQSAECIVNPFFVTTPSGRYERDR